MCLAQGHNAVTPVRLKPAASWSQVKHSATEPLSSKCVTMVIWKWGHSNLIPWTKGAVDRTRVPWVQGK